MAYNEEFVERILAQLNKLSNASIQEKKMFGGICFMVDDKMCCGTHIDVKTGESLLLCRVGEELYESALEHSYSIPMNFTGKPMKGYVYIIEEGFKTEKDLSHWLELCLAYNPMAKKSKK